MLDDRTARFGPVPNPGEAQAMDRVLGGQMFAVGLFILGNGEVQQGLQESQSEVGMGHPGGFGQFGLLACDHILDDVGDGFVGPVGEPRTRKHS